MSFIVNCISTAHSVLKPAAFGLKSLPFPNWATSADLDFLKMQCYS